MKKEQGAEHVSKCIKMTTSRPQSTEVAPTTLLLLPARVRDAAVLPSPSLWAEAVDLRNQWGRERVSTTPENGKDTKKFVCITFNYTKPEL